MSSRACHISLRCVMSSAVETELFISILNRSRSDGYQKRSNSQLKLFESKNPSVCRLIQSYQLGIKI